MTRPALVPPPLPPDRPRNRRAIVLEWFFAVVVLLNPVAAVFWSITGTAWPSIVLLAVGVGLFIGGLTVAIIRCRRRGKPWWTAFSELRS